VAFIFFTKARRACSRGVHFSRQVYVWEDAMFAESILETSWAQRTRRGWTTLTSFGLQTLIIGTLLTIPLLRTVGVPLGRVVQLPMAWSAPPPPLQRFSNQAMPTHIQSNFVDHILVAPPSIPIHVAHVEETGPPPQVSYNSGEGVEGGTGFGSRDGIWKSLGVTTQPFVPRPAPVVSGRPAFRTSTMLQGSLIRRVEPVYPPLARAARIQGQVIVEAIIGKDGTMQHVQLVSGHPMLSGAAIEAVRQWRYRPYILNGEAIEVETQITVNFILAN
jgi:protein TonB